MRYPTAAHIVTCLPCGWRDPIAPGCGYPLRCPNCGNSVEHYETTVDSRREWLDIRRPGTRNDLRFGRPRLVIGSPA